MAKINLSTDQENDLATKTAKPKLKAPPLYKVVLLNDDFTPMEFVVAVLIDYFGMGEEQATQVMLQVHTQGVGVCGVFSKDIAETKVYMVREYASKNNHPLLCTMEKL